MNVRKLALPFLALPLFVAACDGGGGGAGVDDRLQVDPGYFTGQQFECSGASPVEYPNCPPAYCDVDINGQVTGCENACTLSGQFAYCTAFVGPEGIELCAPSNCAVDAGGSVTCDDDCATEPVTCYNTDSFDTACG